MSDRSVGRLVSARSGSSLTSGHHGGRRMSALTASALATAAGGAMDAWVYLATGKCSPTRRVVTSCS